MRAVSGARQGSADGRRTRDEILEYAVQLASREGLESLTIGRLAEALHMSKSGLFAHFGSKQGLQLAVLDRAAQVFTERVRKVGRRFDAGLERLLGLLEAWLVYVEQRDFDGGCFFAAASAEFDGRPGAVRDALAQLAGSWLSALESEARKAVAKGDLTRDVDVAQLVFELHAVVQQANWAIELLGDARSLGRARAAVRSRIRAAATAQAIERLATLEPEITAGVVAARPAPRPSVDASAAVQVQR
jgi:AcrR family transcriptional regulator